MKKNLAIFLCVFLITGNVVLAQDTKMEIRTPMLSDAFVQYSNQVSLQGNASNGSIPEPYARTFSMEIDAASPQLLGTLPSSYDSRTQGYISPVKNQGPDGVCWAFASLASLESTTLKKYPGSSFDFSENHMKHSLAAEALDGANSLGFARNYLGGGNFSMAAAYLSRGTGPVLEREDPYTPSDSNRTLAQTAAKRTALIADSYYILPSLSATATAAERSAFITKVKQMIYDYGAVNISIYSDGNGSRLSWCYGGASIANHAVTAVGWDDSYAAANFSADAAGFVQPSGAGAFIIKNSWGTGVQSGGYFYLSYEDKSFGGNIGVIAEASTLDKSDTVYQYDPFSKTSLGGFSGINTTYIANRFDVKGSGEKITAISFYAATPGIAYEVYVSGNALSPSGVITLGNKVATGTSLYEGYQKIYLPTPVAVTGSSFVVAVKVVTDYSYPIPYERNITNYLTNVAMANDESFTSLNGNTWYRWNWNDATSNFENLSVGNICIKAFTTSNTVSPMEKCRFYSDYTLGASPISDIASGNMTTNIEFSNYSRSVFSQLMFGTALYQGNRLVSFKMKTANNVANAATVKDSMNITVPTGTGYSIRQYVWDSTNSSPLSLPLILD